MLERLLYTLLLSSCLLPGGVSASEPFSTVPQTRNPAPAQASVTDALVTHHNAIANQDLRLPAQIRWMSEQYPPYNYIDPEDQPQGIAVDMLVALWKQLNIPAQPLEFLPWARSYATLLSEPHTALFSMTYTPAREKLFRFVGPIIHTRVVLLAPRSAQLQITSPRDINALNIGVVRDDIGESLLEELGVTPKQIIYSNQADNLVQLLHRGRVDAIAYSDDVAVWNMLKANIDPQDYENVFTLLEGQLGFAFHAQTPTPWLDQLQGALAQLEASGEADQIRQRHLHHSAATTPATATNDPASNSPSLDPASQVQDSSRPPRLE